MDFRAISRSLGPIDLRSIRRDSLLSWMTLMPFLLTLILRLGLPPIQSRVLSLTGFDLTPYFPVILSIYIVMLTPMLFGMLMGFLLLDEMDNHSLLALQVSPLPMSAYVGYRLFVPMVLSLLLTSLIYPLVNLVPLPAADILLMALVAAPAGPILGLFIITVADNKVQGFALLKALGGFLMLPVVAFFVDSQWQLAFGVIPTYWPIKVYWLLDSVAGSVWPYVVIGLLYQGALIFFLMNRFLKKLYR